MPANGCFCLRCASCRTAAVCFFCRTACRYCQAQTSRCSGSSCWRRHHLADLVPPSPAGTARPRRRHGHRRQLLQRGLLALPRHREPAARAGDGASRVRHARARSGGGAHLFGAGGGLLPGRHPAQRLAQPGQAGLRAAAGGAQRRRHRRHRRAWAARRCEGRYDGTREGAGVSDAGNAGHAGCLSRQPTLPNSRAGCKR